MKIPFFSFGRKSAPADSPHASDMSVKRRELSRRIAASDNFTVGVRSNGQILFTGLDEYGLRKAKNWTDIIAVPAAGGIAMPAHIVGLRRDGTVVAAGSSLEGQCDVSSWTNVIAVSAGELFTLGLQANGTILSTGVVFDQEELCEWTNITAVFAGDMCSAALQENGPAKLSSNGLGELQHHNYSVDLFCRTDIIDIALSSMHMAGLCADGSVIATGDNRYGQCRVSEWRNIVSIAAGGNHTVGLRADGTVVAAGRNLYGQCNVDSWRDIVAIAAGYAHTIGVRSNGTLIAAGGANEIGECAVAGWRLF